MRFVIEHSYLIPLLPLLGAMVSGFLGARWLKQQSHWPIWITVGLSAVMSLALLFTVPGAVHEGGLTPGAVTAPYVALPGDLGHVSASVTWYQWINAGFFTASAGAFIDPLTVVMLNVVTVVGLLICIFAAGYMKGEEGYFRFFAYLGLFIFAMTVLVMGNNFIMLYLGWEGVGLCSYLLIGYYYERPSAREAAKKAFLVNRVGDFGFGLGIMLVFLAFGTVSFFGAAGQEGVLLQAMRGDLNGFQRLALDWIPFLLMIGAFGKSAQFPLYVWLPDAMEGPTPVSALIHAATMVTAGVYMIVRCSTLFVANEAATLLVAGVGAFTAIFAATIALRQFDLKKVFAYSTISQLGFMFAAVGVLAPVAGVFHLVTHAFFKALLFLSSGVVMHAMAGELDMRKMSGLKRVLPTTRWLMLIGCLALAGIPPFSGFWSKDEIVISAFHRSWLIGLVLLVTAFLTAYYTFRLYFRVFEGPEVNPSADAHGGHGGHGTHDAEQAHEQVHAHHNHEPMLMILPLVVLAIGALLGGFVNHPAHQFHQLGHFLGYSPSLQLGLQQSEAHYRHSLGEEAGREYLLAPMWGKAEAASEGAGGGEMSLMILSIVVAVSGVLLAYWMHLADRSRAEKLAVAYPGVTRLLEAKYWVDEVYQKGIVESLRRAGRAFFLFDQWVVDGIVNVLGYAPVVASGGLKLLMQRGYLQGYALLMLFGVAVILVIVFL